jgi:hypothetical protein
MFRVRQTISCAQGAPFFTTQGQSLKKSVVFDFGGAFGTDSHHFRTAQNLRAFLAGNRLL